MAQIYYVNTTYLARYCTLCYARNVPSPADPLEHPAFAYFAQNRDSSTSSFSLYYSLPANHLLHNLHLGLFCLFHPLYQLIAHYGITEESTIYSRSPRFVQISPIFFFFFFLCLHLLASLCALNLPNQHLTSLLYCEYTSPYHSTPHTQKAHPLRNPVASWYLQLYSDGLIPQTKKSGLQVFF